MTDIKKSDISFGKSKKYRKKIVFSDQISSLTDKMNIKIDDVEVNKNINDKINGKLMTFKGIDIDVIFDGNGDPWFRGVDIGKRLKYKSSDKAIRMHVDSDEKKKKWEILRPYEMGGQIKSNLSNEMKTIYINEEGIYSLLFSSNKDEAKEFKKWVKHDVLRSINKHGFYDVDQDKIGTAFYADNFISQYEGKRVVYLAYCEIYNEFTSWKYGISRNVLKRDFDQLSKSYDVFRLIYVRECNDNDIVEDYIKKELKIRNLSCPKKVKGKMATELFQTSKDFDIDKVKLMVDQLINNSLIDIANSQEKYNYLSELEKTKQEIEKSKQAELIMKTKEFELKILELQYKNSQK